jgi:hypothetical protein
MDEDQIFTAEAIRDTSNHDSTESNSGEFLAKTIFICNGLDQTVTLQLQGARNSVWVDIGSSFDVANAVDSYQTVDAYFPKYRLQASCSVAPTTGNLDVWIIKAR